jgi:hypothetical protein
MSNEATPTPQPDSEKDWGIGPSDYVLGLLTLPLLLFALMFVTSQQANSLDSPRSRRKLMLTLLVVEVLIVVAIIVAV